MGAVWPTAHITELCLQLTAGSRPVNGDEHRTLRSQSCERVLLTTGTLPYLYLCLIQDYKVYSPCRNNKPSTESLESIVRLSLTFYSGITVGVAPHPHGNLVRRDPIPWYYREYGLHYQFTTVTVVFLPSPFLCRPLPSVTLKSKIRGFW